eukprot:g2152.t1
MSVRRVTAIAVNDVYELINFPKLATLIRSVKASRGSAHPVLTLLAGDFLNPSILSSMDKGLGMIECLNAMRFSHVCFGNHEGDFGLRVLKKRIEEFQGVWLNSNVPTFPMGLPAWDIVRVEEDNCGSVGMLGLLSDEKGMFRGDKFKGHRIESVCDVAEDLSRTLRFDHGVDIILPMTHQSMEYDIELAKRLQCPIIFGGHDHELMREDVGATTILKAGQDAFNAVVVDLEWSSSGKVTDKRVEIVPVENFEEDADVRRLVDSHLMSVKQLDREIVFSGTSALSSRNMRRSQTSVGRVLATACKEELGVDAAMINAGPIKGNRDYADGRVSYVRLKEELPFPTKLVTVDMPGAVLEDAIVYSRRHAPEKEDRGFLQVDATTELDESNRILRIDGDTFDPRREYTVAVPRNLFNGFCDIKPLVLFAAENELAMPSEDNYWSAFNVVISHFSKNLWMQLGSFREMDTDGDGILNVEEIRKAVIQSTGQRPSEIYLRNLMGALDIDNDGSISRQEFNRVVNSGYNISDTWSDSFVSNAHR